MRARLLAAAGIGAASIFAAVPASATPTDDAAFLAALDKQGISYRSPESAISIAKEGCTLLDDGANGVDVAAEISKNSGIPIKDAGYFVGVSISAYCPWHQAAFSG